MVTLALFAGNASAQLPVPQNPRLKKPDQFRYMGKFMHRRDTPLKVNGSAVFGMDVAVPGMLIASIERCPVFGGKVKSFDATAAKRIKGVKNIVQVTNGVAVVADSFWTAQRGRQALKVVWDEGPGATVTSASIRQGYVAGAAQQGQVARLVLRRLDVAVVVDPGAVGIGQLGHVPHAHEDLCVRVAASRLTSAARPPAPAAPRPRAWAAGSRASSPSSACR